MSHEGIHIGALTMKVAARKPLSIKHGMPILTCKRDGDAVSPSVLRQVL